MGVRISSQRLTSEYAKADPVYANKTRVSPLVLFVSLHAAYAPQNLPEAYPEYRPIKGDGNCGFRGMILSLALQAFKHTTDKLCWFLSHRLWLL